VWARQASNLRPADYEFCAARPAGAGQCCLRRSGQRCHPAGALEIGAVPAFGLIDGLTTGNQAAAGDRLFTRQRATVHGVLPSAVLAGHVGWSSSQCAPVGSSGGRWNDIQHDIWAARRHATSQARASQLHASGSSRPRRGRAIVSRTGGGGCRAAGGDLAQLVEQVHGGQLRRSQLRGNPEAAGPYRHGVGEQALDQVLGGILEGGPIAVGETATPQPNPSRQLLDGQGQGAVGHGPGYPGLAAGSSAGRPDAAAPVGGWAWRSSARLGPGRGL
jgi:hypothetical protein